MRECIKLKQRAHLKDKICKGDIRHTTIPSQAKPRFQTENFDRKAPAPAPKFVSQSSIARTMQSPMAITTEMSQQIDFSNMQGEKSSSYEVCKLRSRHLKDVQRGRRYRKLQSRIPSYRSPSGRRKPLEIISESCDVTLRIETRRISFNDQLQTTTTYSKNVYDRSPIATAHTENQSLHLYMELVRYKLTEMKLHMDSVNSINLHMANADPQDLNIRKQIIHDILAASWGSSDLH